MSSSKVSVLAFSLLLSSWCTPGAAQIFVVDAGNNSVLEYDATGTFIRTFVPSGSGGLTNPNIVFGPDGNLYAASGPPATVLRYNGQTGAFMGAFVTPGSGGAVDLGAIVFGPNGNLFAADFSARNVKEYDGATGSFIRVFATSMVSSTTWPNGQIVSSQPSQPLFGPDGNFYLAEESDVEEFDGTTGAFIKAFPSAPGLAAIEPYSAAFGPDGNLYVGTAGPCCPEFMGEILKYNPTTGALIGVFVPPSSGGLQSAGIGAFRPDGNLYVVSGNTAGINSTKQILRYNATSGAFVDVFIAPGNGGLIAPGGFTFAPTPTACQLSLAQANQTIQNLQGQNGQLQTQLSTLNALNAQLQSQLSALTVQNAQLQTQVNALTAQNTQLQSLVNALTAQNAQLQTQLTQVNSGVGNGLTQITSDFRTVFENPAFSIPGTTMLQQYQNLVKAILDLNKGRKQGIYETLGGR